jgi:Arc/MetJ-type ribon-helix-helix transcriptional regulator
VVRELISELLEDEEDIRDGLKALREGADTLDWETFKKEHLGL